MIVVTVAFVQVSHLNIQCKVEPSTYFVCVCVCVCVCEGVQVRKVTGGTKSTHPSKMPLVNLPETSLQLGQ